MKEHLRRHCGEGILEASNNFVVLLALASEEMIYLFDYLYFESG